VKTNYFSSRVYPSELLEENNQIGLRTLSGQTSDQILYQSPEIRHSHSKALLMLASCGRVLLLLLGWPTLV